VSNAVRRLEIFKRLLEHATERLGLDFGFVLWDGSTVPARLPSSEFAVVFADEGVVAALIRRPKLDTFLNLWVSGRVDLRNGSLFDLVARRPKTRTKDFFRSLDKLLMLRTALQFLFVSRGGPWPLEAIRRDRPSSGSVTENKSNIAFHYDISNAFYALFLDPEMAYSCAYFTDWSNDLATAQLAKFEMICRKLRLKPEEKLLDVGCGWGGLICYAAQNYGVRAHGLTLSQKQYDFAREKIARLGLADRVTVELTDYTGVKGEFDKIAQIEMIEHIGLANHATFFKTMHQALKPGGLYIHQASMARPNRFKQQTRGRPAGYRAISRYIFPGGEVDHIGMLIENLQRHGFELHDVEAWREHFARTCRFWHDRLLANHDAAVREVGSVKTRLYLVYLFGCSFVFERDGMEIFQTLASKRQRGPSGVPPSRADLYR